MVVFKPAVSRLYCILLVMLLFLPQAFAIKVVPSRTNIEDDYNKRHDYTISVINDGAKFENVKLGLNKYSSYLTEYVTIEPSSFTLLSNENKNIRISTRFPKNLSPERHELIIDTFTDSGPGPSSIFSFTIPGEALPNLRLVGMSFDNVSADQYLSISLELNNKGNVIARSVPTINFKKDGEVVQTMRYKYITMVMPSEKMNLTLGYDASTLEPGQYIIESSIDYNEDLMTDTVTKELTIFDVNRPGHAKDESGTVIQFVKDNIFFIIFILVVLVGSRVILGMKKPDLDHQLAKHYGSQEISNIETRIVTTENTINSLVGEIHEFVEDSNRWLKSNFGERYEFR